MRNLKRTLSLLLAVVMVIGLMVVGASAVSYNDFPDRDEIVNTDAVSMLTTLGIIEGTDQGTFDPTGGVDRAQMAKMISVIMNQGADNSALYVNSTTGLTDIDNHWAKGHINYCYTLGIIAGRGDGTFDPDAGVTAVEAAKMLLVAAGYDPKIEGFEGSDWAINVNAKASALGIFRNFTKDVTQPLNRDDAALLIYNALDVEMIQKYESGYAIAYSDARTILSAMYGVYKVEGVVVGNKWAELDETDSDEALKDGKTILDNVVLYSSTTANTTQGEGVAQSGKIQFNVDTTADMLGKTVTMYIEKTTILSDSKVLGVTTKDGVNVIETTVANTDTLKNFLKGTGLSATSDTEYYVNYGYCEDTDAVVDAVKDLGCDLDAFNKNGLEVEVIDNNNDGDVDYILYTVETLSEVTRYSESAETLTVTGMNNGRAMSFDDVVFADEVAVDDLVLFVEYGGRAYISLPETVTGTMTRVDRDENKELYITVDGEEYRQSFIPDEASAMDVDVNEFVIADARTNPGFEEATFILDSNGYIVAWTQPEAVANYALVIGSAWTQNAKEYMGQVEILMADGTEGLYTIDWDASEDTLGSRTALENYLGTRDVVNVSSTLDAAAGTVIKYSLDEDDVLTIEDVMHGNEMDSTTNEITKVNDSTKSIVGVAGVGQYAYMESKLSDDYKAGSGTLTVKNWTGSDWSTEDHEYAIDRNTIAFYYENADNYGVAVGWQNMGDLSADTSAQIWPTERKTTSNTKVPTSLADVVLFNKNPLDTMEDYLFVLSHNAFTSTKVMELNVVFEDGTSDVITIDYKEWFENDSAYQCAYKFSVNSNGKYTLDTGDTNNDGVIGDGETFAGVAASTNVVLLKDGTLDIGLTDMDGDGTYERVYPTITGDSNIWDVTDMDDATQDAAPGHFSTTAKNAVVIYTTSGVKSVVTAWVWDIDEDDIAYNVQLVRGNPSYGYETKLGNTSYDTVGQSTATVPMKASDELTLSSFSDGTKTYPITSVTGSGCRIVNNGDGTWTVYDVTDNTTITVTVGEGVIAPVVKIDLSTTYELKVNNAPVDQLRAEIKRVLTEAGYENATANYDATASTGNEWTVTTDGITWKVTVTP